MLSFLLLPLKPGPIPLNSQRDLRVGFGEGSHTEHLLCARHCACGTLSMLCDLILTTSLLEKGIMIIV